MKINIITSPFGDLPPMALGAVEKLFYQLSGVWVRQGHDVCFICAGGGTDACVRYVRLGRYKRTGHTVTDLPIDLWYSLKAVLTMPRCDILVCNTFWSPFWAPLVRWKYKRLVYGVHRYPKGQYWLYRFVHSFICVSTVIGEAVKNRCRFIAKKVRVVCNPVDVEVFHPEIRDNVQSETTSVITVVYTGRITKEKGIKNLAKALRELSEDRAVAGDRKLRLVLVGPWEFSSGGGGMAYRTDILSDFPDTEFVGPVFEPQKIADIIRTADVYCYPTIAEWGEAMPVAPLEAMACGVPVVLPRFRCFADYAADGVNCILYDGVDALKPALERVICDNERRLTIAEHAADSVRRFSVDAVARRYLDIFEHLLTT